MKYIPPSKEINKTFAEIAKQNLIIAIQICREIMGYYMGNN